MKKEQNRNLIYDIYDLNRCLVMKKVIDVIGELRI